MTKKPSFKPYEKCADWLQLWVEDKESLLATMASNVAADLTAGWSVYGEGVQRQLRELSDYRDEYKETLDSFKQLCPEQVARWCFYDLLKQGAIEL